MNHKTNLFGAFLCLVLFYFIAPVALPQDQSDKSKPGDAPTNEDKKRKLPADSNVVLRISVEGMTTVPSSSTIEVNGDEEICKKLKLQQHLEPDGMTSSTLPVCKVKLKIYISGFDSKSISLDLGKYKGPIRIIVKRKGEPVVSP